MCAIGEDSMTASRLCGLMLFAGGRKAPTHRDGSKSASRRVGVPTSAARLRRCPDPDCRLGSLRFACCIVALDSPRHGREISCRRNRHTGLVSGNGKESGHCVSNLEAQFGSVDRGDGEAGSRTCRRQMTQGCIFATKMTSLVSESRRVFLARSKQLRRNEHGGRQ